MQEKTNTNIKAKANFTTMNLFKRKMYPIIFDFDRDN
jgi:hypothetical protein